MISIFNVSVDKNDKVNPLILTNITGDSIKVKAKNNTVVANINTAGEKEIMRPDRISAFSTLKKTVTAEMIVSPVISFASDASAGPQEIERIRISKIDYNKDVKLLEKEFAGTLIAMKTNETSSSEMQEKPGFNEFIAKIFRNRIMKSKTGETGSIKAYEIADAGIIGLNKLLGWQMSLLKTRDDKGDLKSLYFSSKILKFNAPVKKVQFEP
jgi:hypothetical protein